MQARKRSESGKKVRTDFRKKHQGRVRKGDLTREFHEGDSNALDDIVQEERVSGKGELTRRRTIIGATAEPDDAAGMGVHLTRATGLLLGRVLSVHGLQSRVRGDDGVLYECTVRRLLKSLSTEQRHIVAAGDRVALRVDSRATGSSESLATATIERVEPRRNALSRTSRGRQHVIVANVDYLLVVASAAQPSLKPNLIDRFLLTAEQFGIEPIVCINKADLIDISRLQQVAGVYAQLGYRVLFTSAETGQGTEYLRTLIYDSQTALGGQSGVGKSSLLNAIEPQLGLRVGEVSQENDKGKHTTTTAQLIPLEGGGHVIDTPGIRQFELWDIAASEVGGLMRDLRPYVSDCRFPDCLHVTEHECAVKDAVADGRIDARRYDAYCHIIKDL